MVGFHTVQDDVRGGDHRVERAPEGAVRRGVGVEDAAPVRRRPERRERRRAVRGQRPVEEDADRRAPADGREESRRKDPGLGEAEGHVRRADDGCEGPDVARGVVPDDGGAPQGFQRRLGREGSERILEPAARRARGAAGGYVLKVVEDGVFAVERGAPRAEDLCGIPTDSGYGST